MATAADQDPKSEPTKIAPEPKLDPKSKPATTTINLFKADFALRILLLAATAVAVVVMVVSKENKLITTPFSPFPLALDAKFNYSPAFIYFVVANSTACLYAVVTSIASLLSISKPTPSTKLLFVLALFDALMAGVVASATGAGASVAYLGLKGNSHVGWMKVCNTFGKFCRYIGSSVAVSLAASIVLVLLVSISAYSLHRRST